MASVILERIGDFPEGFSLPSNPLVKFRYRIKSQSFENSLPDMECVGIQFAEAIPMTPQDLESLPNEIEIERQGSCDKCGYCCGYGNKKFSECACVHLVRTGNKKGECSIYNNLEDWCAACEDNHASCILPPHQPYPKDICACKFIVTTPGLPITGKEVSRMFWVYGDVDLRGRWIR